MKLFRSNRIKRLFHSIGFELLIYYLSISIVVLAVGSWLVYNSTINMLQKRSEEYIREQFMQSNYNIQNLADEVDRLIKTFAIEDDVQGLLQTSSINHTYDSISMQEKAIDRMTKTLDFNDQISSIYFFTKNGGIGTSQKRTAIYWADTSPVHAFYSSGMFDKAVKAFPKLIWNAGLTDDWFLNSGSVSGNHIISFTKGARPLTSASVTSVIVFNVNESYICNTYSQLAASSSDALYIVDSEGTIISSIHKEDIGKKASFQLDPNAGFKTTYMNSGSKRELIVYDKIDNVNWYLAREIPLDIFENDITVLRNIEIFVVIISVLLIIGASLFSMNRITGPLSSLASRMKDIGRGNLGITIDNIPKNELGVVTMRFNEMSLNIRELMDRNATVEREKNRLEMEALQYQINPHFLYNTLNMIKWMAAVIKAESIMESITALINILHPLYSDYDSTWTLGEEIKCLENYIKIMNWRFKYKIVFKFDIPNELMCCRIIKFILQPVIENSVTHGIGGQNSRIEITVCAQETENGILIMIGDNGIGISDSVLDELRKDLDISIDRNDRGKYKSIGLYNVNRRIKLNFGDGFGISIESRYGKGTNVSINFPRI
jgi:two-component system, sensor histidine kinase YesM